MNAHGQASQDTFIGRVGLQQCRVLEETGEEALQHNLQIMSTRFLGVDGERTGRITSPFTELDQLFPDIEHMAHMTGIDKVFPAPVPVALDRLVGAKGVEEGEMVAIDRCEFLTGLVGLLALGRGGQKDRVDREQGNDLDDFFGALHFLNGGEKKNVRTKILTIGRALKSTSRHKKKKRVKLTAD